MGKSLNIQPQVITYGTVTNLLNGAFASLSGPVGFTPTQPKIRVKSITVVNPSTTTPVEFALYKNGAGYTTPGAEVLAANAGAFSTVVYPVDVVLDAADFLTGHSVSSGSVTVNISAEIEF
jgi:hypothetical protein